MRIDADESPPITVFGESEADDITEPAPGLLTVGERVWFCGKKEEDSPVLCGVLKSIVALEK